MSLVDCSEALGGASTPDGHVLVALDLPTARFIVRLRALGFGVIDGLVVADGKPVASKTVEMHDRYL